MYRITINPNVWVEPNELREDYGWKIWFRSKASFPINGGKTKKYFKLERRDQQGDLISA